MKKSLIQKRICVKKSSMHGYGVFATRDIRKGMVIEECYVLLSKRGHKDFEDFYFEATKKDALLLGYGSIYNHSDTPNADYKINEKKRVAKIWATKTIHKGEEIYISYGEEWFSSRGWKAKKAKKSQAKIRN